MASAAPLKLRARDAEDLRVISAFLQDALVPLSDVAYQQKEKRFVFVANRFCWEDRGLDWQADGGATGADEQADDEDAGFADAEPAPRYARVNCGLRFDQVTKVQTRGIDLRRRDQILSLLSVEADAGAVVLRFSDDGAIRLQVRAIDCHLEDVGEPWPTRWRPRHDLDALEQDD